MIDLSTRQQYLILNANTVLCNNLNKHIAFAMRNEMKEKSTASGTDGTDSGANTWKKTRQILEEPVSSSTADLSIGVIADSSAVATVDAVRKKRPGRKMTVRKKKYIWSAG